MITIATLMRWGPAVFGPILSLIVTKSATDLKWVSLGAGVGLICGAIKIWRSSQEWDMTKEFLAGVVLVILGGLGLLGLVTF